MKILKLVLLSMPVVLFSTLSIAGRSLNCNGHNGGILEGPACEFLHVLDERSNLKVNFQKIEAAAASLSPRALKSPGASTDATMKVEFVFEDGDDLQRIGEVSVNYVNWQHDPMNGNGTYVTVKDLDGAVLTDDERTSVSNEFSSGSVIFQD